ncbi:MAG TPA: heparan-alpha-glucosaminide N-acetyltransferase domain-containing protein [Candidatus Limnocylindrales bacterium]|nr:heparan-alpha-glucosaminide N-acetyltransferase domain-containing protein [Candidatus Limnocylindrales bacterium]
MPEIIQRRLAYIDWMRGFACLMMFQTHCYDSWLNPASRQSEFARLSQLGGTLPAPLFLILAGISFGLVTDKLRERGYSPGAVARTTIRRGAEILALALLFRLQEFLLGFGWAPWTDLFRVDILNAIGLALILMGVTCWLVGIFSKRISSLAGLRMTNLVVAAAISLAISMMSPLVWTSWRPRFLPWPIESYIDGVHIFNQPQSWLFPLFPWGAFAFAGLAVGFFLLTDWARAHVAQAMASLAVKGLALGAFALWLDAQPRKFYANYDFWHTSPEFFLVRLGILLLILFASYVWCRWGAGQVGFSPFIEMGKTSLLVYWVHIEFVYGAFSILKKQQQTIGMATLGLAVIFTSMVALATLRNRWKGKSVFVPAMLDGPLQP